jgi:hypothetical protein
MAVQNGLERKLGRLLPRLEQLIPIDEQLLELGRGMAAVRGWAEAVALVLTGRCIRVIALHDGKVLQRIDLNSPVDVVERRGMSGGDLNVTGGPRSIHVWSVRPAHIAARIADTVRRASTR